MSETSDVNWSDVWTIVIILIIYSVIGAIIEHLSYFLSCKRKIMTNPILTGFPLYAIAPLILLWLHGLIFNTGGLVPTKNADGSTYEPTTNIVVDFLFGAIVLTIVEYIAGLIVGAGPKSNGRATFTKNDGDGHIITNHVNYEHSWDYTNTFLNYKGIINFRHFIIYGIAAVIVLRIYPFLFEKINALFK